MRAHLLPLLTLAVSLVLLSAQPGVGAEKPAATAGRAVADFTLPDVRTHKSVALHDFKDRKAVVVVFTGTECPISNAFLPRLAELHRRYGAQVAFLAIDANVQDSPDQVAAHATKAGVPFPVLKDEGNVIADRFQAERLSEAFLLDAGGTIRYRGRIDDQFGVGYTRPQPLHRDLAEAIDAVLAGKEVAQGRTPVQGCRIARARKPAPAGTVTYNKHVAPVLQTHCQECHRPGQIGPMSLLQYEDAVAWSETIREVLQDGRMPPWFADPHIGTFSNDRRLPPADRDRLLQWIDEGCPRGDRDAPPPRDFARGWVIGKPDVVLTMKEAFDVPAETPRGGVPYQYFTVETNFTEDKWVVQAEAKAGASEVVHHIIIFILPPGKIFLPDTPGYEVLCGAAPGDTALRLPPGTAKRIPAGARLILQMHYTPNGKAYTDRSSVGLVFARTPPDFETHTVPVLNPTFRIPAGAGNFEVESDFTFKEDAVVLGFLPHMHLRGKDFLYEAVSADGIRETLLSVPHFNFNWQSVYRLATPRHMPKGSKIHCVAHYDNSAGNPNNPNPNVAVHWGDQTWQEMMIGWLEFAYDRKPK